MPRKPVLEFHDQFISFCMTAAIDKVTSLLQIGTQIVKVRARTPSDVALPFQTGMSVSSSKLRGRRPKNLTVTSESAVPSVPIAPSPRPATAADAADLAQARERANQAIGAGPRDTRPRRPRVALPPATTAAPDAGDPTPDLDTE